MVQTGKQLEEQKAHGDTVCDLQVSTDGSHMVTASKDKTAKLLDTQTLEVMKTYTTEYPVNTAALSPTEDHVSCCQLAAVLQSLHTCISAACTAPGLPASAAREQADPGSEL